MVYLDHLKYWHAGFVRCDAQEAIEPQSSVTSASPQRHSGKPPSLGNGPRELWSHDRPFSSTVQSLGVL